MKNLIIILVILASVTTMFADTWNPETKKTVTAKITTEVIAPLVVTPPVVSTAFTNVVRGTTRIVDEAVSWEITGQVGESIMCNFTMPSEVTGVSIVGGWSTDGDDILGDLTDVSVPLPAKIEFLVTSITATETATLGPVEIPLSFTYQYTGM